MALPTNQLTSVDKELLSAAKSQTSLLNKQGSVLKGLSESILKQRKELDELKRSSTNQRQILGGNGGMSSLAKMFGAKGAGLKGSPLGPKDETNTGFFKKIVNQITGPSKYQQQLINEVVVLKEITQRQAQDIAFIKNQSEEGAKSRERSLLASAIAKAMGETERPSDSPDGTGGVLSGAAKGIGGVLKTLIVGFGAALTGAAMLITKFGKSLPGLFIGALRFALTPVGIAAIIAALIGVKAYKELQGKSEGAELDADGEPIKQSVGDESFVNKLKRVFIDGELASDVFDKKNKEGSEKAQIMQKRNSRTFKGMVQASPRPADPAAAAVWDKQFGGKYDPLTGNPLPEFEQEIVNRTRGPIYVPNKGWRVGGAQEGPDPTDKDVMDTLDDTLDTTTDYFKDFNEGLKKALEGLDTIGDNIIGIAKDTLNPSKIEDMLNNLLTISFGEQPTDTINLAPYLGTAVVQTLKDITEEAGKLTDYVSDKAAAATNIVTNNTVMGTGNNQGSTSAVIPGSAKRNVRDSWGIWTDGLGKR
jgi:hypothetical protein